MNKVLLFLFFLGLAPLAACKSEEKLYPHTFIAADVPLNNQIPENTVSAFNTKIYMEVYTNDEKEDLLKEANEFSSMIGNYHRLFDRHEYYSIDNSQVNNLKVINDSYGRNEELEIEEALYDILNLSLDLGDLTDGYFNIAVGRSADLWLSIVDFPYLDLPLPTDSEISAALSCTPTISELRDLLEFRIDNGKYFVKFQSLSRCATSVNLTLGGIGKGYATTKVIEHLKKQSRTQNILIVAGGSSIAFNGKLPKETIDVDISDVFSPWISSIGKIKFKDNFAISTSGVYERGLPVKINGESRVLHHIINPFTGWPMDYHGAITVIGQDATILEGISTALISMPLEEGKLLLNKLGKEYGAVYQTKFNWQYFIDGSNPSGEIHFVNISKKMIVINEESVFYKYGKYYIDGKLVKENYFKDNFWSLIFPISIVSVFIVAGLIYGLINRKKKYVTED